MVCTFCDSIMHVYLSLYICKNGFMELSCTNQHLSIIILSTVLKLMLENHFRNAEVRALWAMATLDVSKPATKANAEK